MKHTCQRSSYVCKLSQAADLEPAPQDRALAISSVAEEQGRHASEVSVSVDHIAGSSRDTVEAIERSDQASGQIAETLASLQAKASQFRV